ncbi:MAG: DNA repair protein RecO C-terminal domain-containing protein, partial [Chloroflexota bacterium]
ECVVCRASIRPTANLFSASGGGVLCPLCQVKEAVFRHLSLDALKVLRFMQDEDYSMVAKVRLQADLSVELEYLLREYICYLLEREVKSVTFMDSLRKEKRPQQDRVAAT